MLLIFFKYETCASYFYKTQEGSRKYLEIIFFRTVSGNFEKEEGKKKFKSHGSTTLSRVWQLSSIDNSFLLSNTKK